MNFYTALSILAENAIDGSAPGSAERLHVQEAVSRIASGLLDPFPSISEAEREEIAVLSQHAFAASTAMREAEARQTAFLDLLKNLGKDGAK